MTCWDGEVDLVERRDYQMFHPPKPPDQSNRARQRLTWKPTPRPKLKANFNGSVFREENYAGVGTIIQDDSGQVVAWQRNSLCLTQLLQWKLLQLKKLLGLL